MNWTEFLAVISVWLSHYCVCGLTIVSLQSTITTVAITEIDDVIRRQHKIVLVDLGLHLHHLKFGLLLSLAPCTV